MAIEIDGTKRVGELPVLPISLTDKIAHEVGTDLSQGTVQELADIIGAYLGTSDGLAFNPTTVNDGETLPATTSNEWILVGKGTFTNVGGGASITTTEELNALTSNGVFWSLSVEIPINIEVANLITQNIRTGYTTTTPSEDAVFNGLAGKKDNFSENTAFNKDFGTTAGTVAEGLATQTALDSKANLESPEFTGTPTAPTATAGTNTNQIATTAFASELDASNVKLLGNQAITGKKSFNNSEATIGGITINNSRTTQTGYGQNHGLTIFNTGELGLHVETTGASDGNASGFMSGNAGSAIRVGVFSTGTGIYLTRQGSSTGALLTAETDKLVIDNGGKLTTKQNIASTGYEVTGESDASVVLAGGGTALKSATITTASSTNIPTVDAVRTIGASVTTNYIPKSNGNGTFSNSIISENSGVTNIAGNLTARQLAAVSDFNVKLVLNGATDPNKQFLIGYEVDGNASTLQSVHQGVAYTPIVMQRDGGSVLIGSLTADGSKLQVSGNVTATGFKTPTGTNTKFLLDGGSTVLAKDIDFSGLPTYINNADAIAGGVAVGKLYKTASGDIKIVQ